MSKKKNAEISFDKKYVYHAIGTLLVIMFGYDKEESVFELDSESELFICQTNEASNVEDEDEENSDFEDQLMSVVALLCEPLKGHPNLIKECKNYCLMNCGIAVESIEFDDEKKPHLTLVKSDKAD